MSNIIGFQGTPAIRDRMERELLRKIDGVGGKAGTPEVRQRLVQLRTQRIGEGRFCGDSEESMAARRAALELLEEAQDSLEEAIANSNGEAAAVYQDALGHLDSAIALIERPSYEAKDV